MKIVEEYHHSQGDKNDSKVEKVINKAFNKLSLFGSSNDGSPENGHHNDSSKGEERAIGGKVDPLRYF